MQIDLDVKITGKLVGQFYLKRDVDLKIQRYNYINGAITEHFGNEKANENRKKIAAM